jgi:hypothetical protein
MWRPARISTVALLIASATMAIVDTIMVVLSLPAEGTSYEVSTERLTTVTRALYVANCPRCDS